MTTSLRIWFQFGLIIAAFAPLSGDAQVADAQAESVLRTDRLYVVGLSPQADVDAAGPALPVAEEQTELSQTGFVIRPEMAPIDKLAGAPAEASRGDTLPTAEVDAVDGLTS